MNSVSANLGVGMNAVAKSANAVARNISNAMAPSPNVGVNGSNGSNAVAGIFSSTTAILLALFLLVVLFAVYYETVGYYFQLGWEGLGWSRAHGEQIKIDGPGGLDAWMLPSGGSGERRRPSKGGPKGGGSLINGIEQEVDRLETDVETALGENQVFNVNRNIYKYEEAEPLCRAFGAELATYDQVKSAYQAGGDWCNYGWSKGQMALFPTQQGTYDRLQESESKEERESCGVPGVNGGYFPNPDERFGVNCYGKRPIGQKEYKGDAGNPDNRFQHEVDRFKSELSDIALTPFA